MADSKQNAGELHKPVIPMTEGSRHITVQDLVPTALPDAFLTSECARHAAEFSLPCFDELPCMPLYRDQVVLYIESLLQPLNACCDGPWITPSMINNYVKLQLVDPPHKKQYAREQVGRLLLTCAFKQFLSIAAIKQLFWVQKMTYPLDVAYDYCIRELNQAVACAFQESAQLPPDSAHVVTRESLLVRSAASAFASKAYLMTYLNYLGYTS